MGELETINEETELIHNNNVPIRVLRGFGCEMCDWCHTERCPETDERGITKVPEGLLCEDRKRWLLNVVPKYSKPPTIARWRQDFNQAINQKRALADIKQANIHTQRAKELEQENGLGLVEELIKSELLKARALERKADRLLGNVQKYDNTQLDRETTKKVDNRSLIMRGSPKDIGIYLEESKRGKD